MIQKGPEFFRIYGAICKARNYITSNFDAPGNIFLSLYPLVIVNSYSLLVHATIPENSGVTEEEMKEKNRPFTAIA
jgi:hypothetical protein